MKGGDKTKYSMLIFAIFLLGNWDTPTSPTDMRVSLNTTKAYYVDPDYSGTTKDGTPEHPWNKLDYTEWVSIDNSLSQSDVCVFYSSREASTDTDEISTFPVKILRTNTSSFRVTLDGMSKYNTNDTIPVWAYYSGPSKLRIDFNTGPVVTTLNVVRNNVTISGFKATPVINRSGAWIWGGSHFVFDHTEGIEFNYNYCWKSDGSGSGVQSTDIIVSNNVVDRCNGECIYIGGSDETYDPSVVAHSNIIIENNVISNARYFDVAGSEGDAIDIKRGNRNVVVRNNRITHGRVGTAAGVIATCPAIVEGNTINDFENGIRITSPVGLSEIKGNIVYDNIQRGLWLGGAGGSISNNTVAGNGEGIYLASEATVQVKNNILFQNIKQVVLYGSGKLFDYNLYFPNQAFTGHDVHFVAQDPLFVDYPKHNFALLPASPAHNGGEGGTYIGALP